MLRVAHCRAGGRTVTQLETAVGRLYSRQLLLNLLYLTYFSLFIVIFVTHTCTRTLILQRRVRYGTERGTKLLSCDLFAEFQLNAAFV